MLLIVRIWTLMFWVPTLVSAATGSMAMGRGFLARPVPVVLWFLAALLFQILSAQFSLVWIVGLVTQSALAIYLSILMKLRI